MKHLAAEAFVQFDEAKRNELSKLISARLENPVETFSDFVLKLQELGIQKHTFDSFKDEISFFTKDEHVYSVVWEELKTIRKNEHWQLSDALDVSELKIRLSYWIIKKLMPLNSIAECFQLVSFFVMCILIQIEFTTWDKMGTII